MTENMLDITNLTIWVAKKDAPKKMLIHDIQMTVPKGEIVGIVGESGSGKSITMKSLMHILPENVETANAGFLFNNRPVGPQERIPAAMIFQDPMTALNPLRTIGYHLVEVIRRSEKMSKKEAEQLAAAELAKVGITMPEKRLRQYPHELSGGMRQRVMIAMALLAKPELLIADEPTTALDVTIQAQILSLIRRLQREEQLTVILVTHDFGVVAGMCQSIKVMYQGRIVEEGTTEEIFYDPRHDYTKNLLKAIPTGEKGKRLYSLGSSSSDSTESDAVYTFQQVSPTHRYLVKQEG
ncbi:ABC transporter ATP-binding protein [Vagococcus acidifermentans]|uniref:ABC transporter ATP-binding protein n=1 Tax=Vagococcus acidifermentans TaxID=564710 RepID=A0A430ASF8_9ENTE|nr:ABC transporter ATP-binding protein [Vagococcus acidifermentans]RSU10970.1 ABC transporter ATP-binding protein [Vagococcus acidifermentans]